MVFCDHRIVRANRPDCYYQEFLTAPGNVYLKPWKWTWIQLQHIILLIMEIPYLLTRQELTRNYRKFRVYRVLVTISFFNSSSNTRIELDSPETNSFYPHPLEINTLRLNFERPPPSDSYHWGVALARIYCFTFKTHT